MSRIVEDNPCLGQSDAVDWTFVLSRITQFRFVLYVLDEFLHFENKFEFRKMNALLAPRLLEITVADPLGDASMLVNEMWFLLFLQIVYSYYLEWNILTLLLRLTQMARLFFRIRFFV